MSKSINRIHILGASGSGASTLGQALGEKLGYRHFDTDYFYWLQTNPPFQIPREIEERQKLLLDSLTKHDRWVLTGSLCGWGDMFISLFDLVVYLEIPKDIRIERLVNREEQRYGRDAVKPGGKMYQQFAEFIEWASSYDDGGLDIRSKALHNKWLSELPCQVLRIEGDTTVDARVEIVLCHL